MILLFLLLRLLPFKGLFYLFTFLPFKGLFTFLPFYFFTFKKQAVHGGFYSYINQ